MTTEPSRRFPVGLTIATAIALAILVSLGVWQVHRLAWKEALLARIAALQGAPAHPAARVLDRDDAEFSRVELDCPGLGAKPFLQMYFVGPSGAGVRLVSACALAGSRYGSILVDRGFVADTISARPPVDPADRTPARLVGVLRSHNRRNFVTPPNDVAANHWYSGDIPQMAQALGAKAPAPLFLMAETSANPGFPALVPAPLPAEIANRHLEYAVTWFGLAAALACVYAASLWKRWKS